MKKLQKNIFYGKKVGYICHLLTEVWILDYRERLDITRSLNLKIQSGGSNMADQNCKNESQFD